MLIVGLSDCVCRHVAVERKDRAGRIAYGVALETLLEIPDHIRAAKVAGAHDVEIHPHYSARKHLFFRVSGDDLLDNCSADAHHAPPANRNDYIPCDTPKPGCRQARESQRLFNANIRNATSRPVRSGLTIATDAP